VLFEPDDEHGLRHALEEALVVGQRPDVAEECRAAARPWDWSAVMPQYEAVYEEAVSASAEPRAGSPAARAH